MSTDMVDLATAGLGADSATTDNSSATDQTVETTTTNDSDVQIDDASGAESEESSSEGKESETHNADGTEKSEEEQEAFKTAAAAKGAGKADATPVAVRQALKALRDLDPKHAAIAKQLHQSFERFEAVRPLLGTEGVSGLRSFLTETGAKDLAGARQAYAEQSAAVQAVQATDELLYSADKQLSQNVFDDMKASGKEAMYGKVVANFVQHLKDTVPEAYYEISKVEVLSGLQESGFVEALNSAFAKIDSDPKAAKQVLASIGKWFSDLRSELGESSKISKERQQWNAEREAKETETQKAERTKVESGIAETCDKANNVSLGKQLGAYLRMPFFKNFPRETLVDLGNGIKERLYSTLKADKAYQTQMSAMWKAKNPDREKMVQYHTAKLNSIAEEIVRATVQNRYPGYAKGGSAAGRVAAAAEKKVADSKAASASVSTGKPIYVASRPTNLIRERITVGSKEYSESDLTTLQILGRGFVRSGDGKGYKFISWRKS